MASSQMSITQPTSEIARATEWPAIQRIAFRFFFPYFVLSGLPSLLPYLPFGGSLSDQWFLGTVAIGRWLILHVLELPEHGTLPSTDRLDLFLFHMLVIGISIVVALGWSILDVRRRNYSRLYVWLYGLVRIALAAEMFGYGWSKLLPYQFWGGQVPLYNVAEPLGHLNPQGLLWALMGFSRPYAIFAGALEWLGALFLCFRRTATLGAVILIGTLANVVALNFAFDVPVKLGAANLLVMALFVAAPDLNRLAKLLLLNRPTGPGGVGPLFRSAQLTRLTTFGAPLLAAFLAYKPLASMLPDLRIGGREAPPPPLYGIFEVDSVARNGTTMPPLLSNTTRWRRVVFERSNRASITWVSDSMRMYRSTTDTNARTVQLSMRVDTLHLTYARPDEGHLELRGFVGGDGLVVWLRYIPSSAYPLFSARHRWAW
jgi:hypothetical protein